jgi:hypothetical protein
MSKLQEHVLVEVALVDSSSSFVRTKAVSVRSMSKRFPERWLAEHKVWHFKWFDLHLLQLLCVGGRCSHSNSRRSHPTAILNHNKERIGRRRWLKWKVFVAAHFVQL